MSDPLDDPALNGQRADFERRYMDEKTPSRPGLEQDICKKYERIVGYCPIGLTETLRILTGPDMLLLMEAYIAEKKAEDGTD